MSYKIAGIDVHKKVLAVSVANIEDEGEYQFERRQFGSNPDHLRLLAEWLIEKEVKEVVMESTAQYWKPVWGALELHWKPNCQRREGAGPMSGTSIWHRHSPIEGRGDARRISPMPNDW